MITPGIYTNLTSDEYHGDKHSISRSALMDFKKCPRKYWAKHLNPERPESFKKASWTFGTAFHTLVLEPLLFEQHYFVMPPKVLKRDDEVLFNVHKAAEKEAEVTNKEVLSYADFNKLFAMQQSLYANEKARELLAEAIYESSYFWEDKESGLILKSRPDILHPRIYVDLKTIDDASEYNYGREMMKYGYHIQAAMVDDAIKTLEDRELLGFINLCVEKEYPYCIGIRIIDDSAIRAGKAEYKKLCVDLKHAIMHNEFPDYDIATIGLPSWY